MMWNSRSSFLAPQRRKNYAKPANLLGFKHLMLKSFPSWYMGHILIQSIPSLHPFSYQKSRPTERHMVSASKRIIAHDAWKWSLSLNPIFFLSQDHHRYRQMEPSCQMASVSLSSLRCRAHRTASHQQPHQLGLILARNLPWFHRQTPFIFRLSPSHRIPSSFTNHRSCLTELSAQHIHSHRHNIPSKTAEDCHQLHRETHQVHRQTISQHQITKSTRLLSSTRQTTIHHTHRLTIPTMSTSMSPMTL